MTRDCAALGSAEGDDQVPEIEASRSRPALRGAWILVMSGGVLGTVTATWQTVDRITRAGAPDNRTLVCDINAVLSCSSVFDHWQSSALGIPNALIALPVFSAIALTGLSGLLGSRLSAAYLVTVLGLTIFMASFVTWYMQQSAFHLGVLCLLCAACALSIVVAGLGLTHVAAYEHAFGRGRIGRELKMYVSSGADLVAWLGLALIIAAMLVVGLTL